MLRKDPASRSISRIEILALRTLPEVRPGQDLARLVVEAAEREYLALADGDVLVLAQKTVSKAEGRLVRLSSVKPSEAARAWALLMREDPRFQEVVLRETRRIVRMTERVLIVETQHGWICANAGVDRSNIKGRDWVACLPRDPDATAERLVRDIRKRLGIRTAVIISDTFGRPWRMGLTNVAIGAAGIEVLHDLRGTRDAYGHRLKATVLATADELAAAAGLAMGKAARIPAVIVRGFPFVRARDRARRLIRPAAEDLFR
jgi:coenzyme F420-0:L-glutamate ligase/coenzyme F420-1:gamma-L-glutamate ligase